MAPLSSTDGFVKAVIGDTPCVACGINEYAANGTTFVAYPAHAEARPGSWQCTCAPPYVLREHACVLCPVNHFLFFCIAGIQRAQQ
jgi:hypothetical protein